MGFARGQLCSSLAVQEQEQDVCGHAAVHCHLLLSPASRQTDSSRLNAFTWGGRVASPHVNLSVSRLLSA